MASPDPWDYFIDDSSQSVGTDSEEARYHQNNYNGPRLRTTTYNDYPEDETSELTHFEKDKLGQVHIIKASTLLFSLFCPEIFTWISPYLHFANFVDP